MFVIKINWFRLSTTKNKKMKIFDNAGGENMGLLMIVLGLFVVIRGMEDQKCYSIPFWKRPLKYIISIAIICITVNILRYSIKDISALIPDFYKGLEQVVHILLAAVVGTCSFVLLFVFAILAGLSVVSDDP